MRLIAFVYLSTLGLRVIKKKKKNLTRKHISLKLLNIYLLGGSVLFWSYIVAKIANFTLKIANRGTSLTRNRPPP